MKIMTLGQSPYILNALGRLNADILKRIYLRGEHSVASIIWNHDTTLFIPEERDGQSHFYYEFDAGSQSHKIPLVPLSQPQKAAVHIYEILNIFSPDMIISIGDVNDFAYMKAVKLYATKPFKWLSILVNHSYPFSDEHVSVINDMDAILCTNFDTHKELKSIFHKDILEMCHVGHGFAETSKKIEEKKSHFQILSIGKNSQTDNLPMLMQSFMEANVSDAHLRICANIHDSGEYDLLSIRDRFDSKKERISFPDKYLSIYDGLSDYEIRAEMEQADICVCPAMICPSAMSAFDAISCGCLPLMSDAGCSKDIATILSKKLEGFEKEDLLIRCIELVTIGGVYLNVCDPEDMKEKMLKMYEKIKKNNKGLREKTAEIIKKQNRSRFLDKVCTMINRVELIKHETLTLETV